MKKFAKTNLKRYTNSVIGIPVGKSLVQTLVLWHSGRFKNVILLAPTNRLVSPKSDTTELGSPIGLMFGSAECIRGGYWKHQGTVDIEVTPEVYTFESGGHIFKGDKPIGQVGSRKGLMTLGVWGRTGVEELIADILKGKLTPFQNKEQVLARKVIRKYLKVLTDQGDG